MSDVMEGWVGEQWLETDELPALASDEVQIWRIELRPDSVGLLDRAYAVLNEEERGRAARMRAGGPRNEFVAGRGSLRRLLGAAVGLDPHALVLEKQAHGKPTLEAGIWFNVAHSQGVILIGLSRAGEVGVDVEFTNSDLELEEVAQTAFHHDELARVLGADTAEFRLAEFYRCWTRKEAVLKADGRGLTIEPRSFAVGPDNGGEVEVLLPAEVGGQGYFVRGIDVGASHAAAVAAERCRLGVRCYQFPADSFQDVESGPTHYR